MFDGLSGKFGDIFDRLRRQGALSEADVNAAAREIRIALLEADVALPVVKSFIDKVKNRAVGQEVIRSVTPGQQVVKIVHDTLVEMLGGQIPAAGEAKSAEASLAGAINLMAVPPVPILMVGLQGSGKTTTSAKIGKYLAAREGKKVLLASLDTRRPAAMEQLQLLAEQAGLKSLPIVAGQNPVQIAQRAMEAGRLQGFDVVILDTAGRLAIDMELMAEVAAVRGAVDPVETLLVTDAMTGQDAVAVAESFDTKLGITGIVLTRVDGDARGGAALSMRAVTGKPIKLIGVGEGLDALEAFHPERIAGRILGMGDVVSLVEKAAATIEQDQAEKLAGKLQKGQFDLEDLRDQLRQMRKMGGLKGLMSMLPGVGKMQSQMKAHKLDDSALKRQEAIINSMTPGERRNPRLIQAKRKIRISRGSGTTVQEVNKLLKQHQQMAGMMKSMSKMGKKKGKMGLPPGLDLPPELSGGLSNSLPGGLPGGGLPGGGLPNGLPSGFPGGLPGLPGFKK